VDQPEEMLQRGISKLKLQLYMTCMMCIPTAVLLSNTA